LFPREEARPSQEEGAIMEPGSELADSEEKHRGTTKTPRMGGSGGEHRREDHFGGKNE